MGFFKDIYINQLEREYEKLVAQGVMPDRAYTLAGENVYQRMREIVTSELDKGDQALDRTR
jgi:hypothetical protein